MKPKPLIEFFKTRPFFLFLLPLFFVLHGYTENYDFVPVTDSLLLILIYLTASLALAGLFWLLYRNFMKAAIVSFSFMAYHFFFGSIQDFLRNHFTGTFFSRYSFILPVSFLLFILLIIWVKKRKKPLQKLTFYLNFLLMTVLVIEAGLLFRRANRKQTTSTSITINSSRCDTCRTPDIFFILLDEYSGNTTLKDLFNFDNASFENELRKRNFHIISKSRGNYNYTPFSMASILNMDYLKLNMETKGKGNLSYCYETIKNCNVLKFLTTQGYRFYNYSIFDFPGQPAPRYDNFLPRKTKLITSQTFISRIVNDIQYNIATGKFSFKPVMQKISYDDFHNNEYIIRQTDDLAKQNTQRPKFVYAHLIMPHYPYYFNSKAVPLTIDKLTESNAANKKDYIEYMQYCNQRILKLVDHILSESSRPPVIMLLGDHGFRHFREKQENKYYFLNLNAVYLPDKNYNRFYDSMTTVNQFRIFFNTQFHEQFPLLKDSTIYLWEK